MTTINLNPEQADSFYRLLGEYPGWSATLAAPPSALIVLCDPDCRLAHRYRLDDDGGLHRLDDIQHTNRVA